MLLKWQLNENYQQTTTEKFEVNISVAHTFNSAQMFFSFEPIKSGSTCDSQSASSMQRGNCYQLLLISTTLRPIYPAVVLVVAVVRRRTRDRKVAGSTPGRGAIKSTRSTQPSIPPG